MNLFNLYHLPDKQNKSTSLIPSSYPVLTSLVPGSVYLARYRSEENTSLVRSRRDYDQNSAGIIPFHRGGKPEEVANAALFLALDESSYVTGRTYTVDGTLSIHKI